MTSTGDPDIDRFNDKYITIRDASIKYGFTVQTIYIAIKEGKMNTIDFAGKRWLFIDEIENYERYSRENRTREEGCLTVKQFSELTGFTKGKIYYLIYKKLIKANKCHKSFVIHKDESKKIEHLAKIERWARYNK